MPETITLKQAMPTAEDRKIVLDFLHWLDTFVVSDLEYVKDENDDDIEVELSDEDFLDKLRNHFESPGRNFGTSWQRVVYAGLCALDNSCDPTADVLQWKPEIARGLELVSAEATSGTARTYAHRWGYDDEEFAFTLQVNDQAPPALAVITLRADSGVTAEASVYVGPNVELRIPIMATEGEWISGRMSIDGKLVDTFGVRVPLVTCPRCLQSIDKPAKPSTLQLIVDMLVNEKTRQDVMAKALAERPNTPPLFILGVEMGLMTAATLLAAGKKMDATAGASSEQIVAGVSAAIKEGLEQMVKRCQS